MSRPIFTGAVLKAFFNDREVWANEAYCDDCLFEVDGEEISERTDFIPKLSDTAQVRILSGDIFNADPGYRADFESALIKFSQRVAA